MSVPNLTESAVSEEHPRDRADEGHKPAQRGAAVVFVRRKATMGIGHVGWGFLVQEGSAGTMSLVGDGNVWEIGAVENHHGWIITPPLEDGYWRERTAQPLSTVAGRGYDHYKVVPVEVCNLDAAVKAERAVSERPYMAAVGNCMNDVYEILTAYGVVHLPNPHLLFNWLPNAWYDHIHAQEYAIEDPSGLADDSEHGRGA
jgi:hypothetical protein